MNASRLQQFLHEKHVPYEVIHHARANTALETAASAHISDDRLAKTVMIKLDGRLAMAVLPASNWVRLDYMRRLTGADNVELASEDDFRDRFPDCEIGAMPPFGNLYDMDVYIDEHLASSEDIIFNDGTHTDLVRMPFDEFERLVRPVHAELGRNTPRM